MLTQFPEEKISESAWETITLLSFFKDISSIYEAGREGKS